MIASVPGFIVSHFSILLQAMKCLDVLLLSQEGCDRMNGFSQLYPVLLNSNTCLKFEVLVMNIVISFHYIKLWTSECV